MVGAMTDAMNRSAPRRVAAWVSDRALRVEVARAAAAAGAELYEPQRAHDQPPGEAQWARHGVIVLDAPAAAATERAGRPRRHGVVIVTGGGAAASGGDERGEGSAAEPVAGSANAGVWQAAVRLGAEDVLELPADAPKLLAALSPAADRPGAGGGGVITVVSGHGGAGASVLASALALTAPLPSLLVDLDPTGSGLDLLLGIEGREGLRWPDLRLQDGRVDPAALHRALPRRQSTSVLAAPGPRADPPARAVRSVLGMGGDGGSNVVCDASSRRGESAAAAVESADMTVLVVTADVPSCAAAVRTVSWLRQVTGDAALVVRGPSPGGLRGADVEGALGLPLLAAMRPEPGLARRMEHGGVSFARRSPLAEAARAIHEVHARRPAEAAA